MSATGGEEQGPVLLFDGHCKLCNGLVLWLIEHDPHGRLHFASLHSESGARLLRRCAAEPCETLVLVEGNRCVTHSTAALRALAILGGAWRLLALLRVLPRPWRDAAYNIIAQRRYRWFGRRDQGTVAEGDLADRFLD